MNMIFKGCTIWKAEDEKCVGSKILNPEEFRKRLVTEIIRHDHKSDSAPGQHVVTLSYETIEASGIVCGIGLRTNNLNDYIIRSWRGQVGLYLKRECAVPVEMCRVIVYTKEAMIADPDVDEDYKNEIMNSPDHKYVSHYLIALLADGPEPSARSPLRLTAAIGGHNNEYENASIEKIKSDCLESYNYATKWEVVSD